MTIANDATAAAQAPGLDGYTSALTNFRFLAHCSRPTAAVVVDMKKLSKKTAKK